jgi:hypothetical protein
MVFLVDAQGEKVMNGLLDLALKGGGMQNLPLVTAVKQAIKVLPDPPQPEEAPAVAEQDLGPVGGGNTPGENGSAGEPE